MKTTFTIKDKTRGVACTTYAYIPVLSCLDTLVIENCTEEIRIHTKTIPPQGILCVKITDCTSPKIIEYFPWTHVSAFLTECCIRNVPLSSANIHHFAKLPYLQSLTLCQTGLTWIPEKFFDACNVHLRHVDFSHNDLTSLPERMGHMLVHLESLDCSHNSLIFLPASLCYCTRLIHLQCSNNEHLCTFPPFLNDQMLHIQFANCGFKLFPSMILHMRSLLTLEYSGNLAMRMDTQADAHVLQFIDYVRGNEARQRMRLRLRDNVVSATVPTAHTLQRSRQCILL